MSAHWMDEDPDSPAFTEAECIALEALRARIRQENGVPMLTRVGAVTGDHRPVSRPGPMILDDVPPWMYRLDTDTIMAIPRRRGLLTWLILGAALVGALVLVGVMVWWVRR